MAVSAVLPLRRANDVCLRDGDVLYAQRTAANRRKVAIYHTCLGYAAVTDSYLLRLQSRETDFSIGICGVFLHSASLFGQITEKHWRGSVGQFRVPRTSSKC